MKESKTLKSFRELNRKIFINDSTKNSVFKYIANGIQTRKYTLISFLPKSLYIQFLRIANVYFLITAVISSIGEVSSVTPITSILPLAFVLGTSIVREAFEDYKRYKNDRSINNQSASVYQKTGPNVYDFAPIRWKEIIVGDLVKVQNNEEIPADMVLLSSSDENGLAYVETANLDGERNLKLKQPNYEIKELVKKIGVAALKGAMLVEGPNQRIHHFKGIIEIEGLNPIYLNYGNLLLRGTHLKNTSHVVGLVVYTGHDSKLLRNQGTFRNKRSSIERQLNRYIVGIFVAQLAMCLLLTLLSIFFRDKYFGDSEGLRLSYLYSFIGVTEEDHSGVVQAFITFASFLLLLNTMIPISLMVSLEVAKWFQATWLEFDELMWEGDQKSKVLNMLIHEDLGRIDYVFADKTGTLTSNEMRFTHCSIGGKVYSKELLLQNLSASPTGSNEEEETEDDTMYHKFWLTIAICHDIVINNKVEEDGDPRARYQGSSPDEVELVSMASEVRYTFKEKKADIYTVNIEGKLKDFRVIVKIDFSSDRKRMSIIARDLETEKLYLFCKGADSIVLKRVKKEAPVELIEKTNEDLQMFSKEGLRTLVIAYKELEEKSFLAWHEKYYNAQLEQYNAIDDDHHAGMAALEDEIEQDLVLLGATALEDKLQEGVAETISDLHKAGIKIWMLTGDKLETAENIGYATNLIAQNTKVFKVKATQVDQALEEYKNIERQLIEAERKNMEVSLAKKDMGSSHLPFIGDNHTTFALIIDGEAISYTFHDNKLKPLFISLIPRFRTVICCRSTPNQKADVVTFVKTNLHKITLAIGDGGNDVNMIQKADIGIGLFGKEGNQAAFAADYAFVKFFFLWRLILVHGRWFYLRTSNFINYFFYKNLIFTLPQFWFGLYSAYSGQSMYDNAFITNFNTVFTSVAPVYYAAQEQDVNPRENETIRKALPYVYAEFRDKLQLFASKKFLFWWTIGVVHSIVVFYLTKFIFETPVDDNGLMYEMWNESLTAFAGVFLTVFSVMVMGTNYYHCIGFLCYIVFTLFLYFPVGSFITDEGGGNTSGLLVDALNTPKFWLALLLILTVCVLILYIPKQYQSYFYPNLVDLLQRDRNRRWKKKLSKEEAYEMRSPTKLLTSTGDFDFNQRIMLNSWYKPITVGMTTNGSMA